MCISLFVALTLVAQAPAAAPTEDAAARVRTLVREFDSPQKAARDEAERRLLELGPAALEALATLPAATSAEAVLRIDRVRTELYRRRAAASLDASTVTLDVRVAPLHGVLTEIEKQTGNRMLDFRRQFGQRADDVRVTLKCDREPFWKAVDMLSAATGLEVYHFAGGDGLALVAAAEGAPAAARPSKPVVYSGAFRLEVRRLVASRKADGAAPGELQIDWEVVWEPRLKPLFFTTAAAKMHACDDTGAALTPTNPDLTLEIPPQGKACRVELSALYQAPSRKADRLAEFAGTVDVLVPAERHAFRFEKLADGPRREERVGAVTVGIETPRENDGAVVVPLRLKYDNAANALESHRAWFYRNPAYLEAADGLKTPPASVELARQSSNELMLNLVFGAVADWRSQTLVYETPADIVALPIPFSFHDLPLP